MAAKFCWCCGRKLWGGQGIEMMVEGYLRTLHKFCAKHVLYILNKE